MKKTVSILLSVLALFLTLCSCDNETIRVADVLQSATTVNINGTEATTVEAKMGAFSGKQGDYIEFIFDEPHELNTVFISEKTATVRQFNIHARVDGRYKMIYTSKLILNEDIKVDTVTADALKIEIMNTEIGNDSFTLLGVSAYMITDNTN